MDEEKLTPETAPEPAEDTVTPATETPSAETPAAGTSEAETSEPETSGAGTPEAEPTDAAAAAADAEMFAKKQEDNIMAVIESLLFAYEKPLTVDQIKKVLDNLDAAQVRKTIEKLMAEYEANSRGMRIVEIAGGYKMISAPQFSAFLRKLFKGPQNAEKLSGPSMETLAIIAYKQPISKMEIEALRKVNADGVVQTLVEKNLVRVTGRKDAPGRPKVYGTSREFLEYFGLKSLDDLPKLEHFPLSPEKQREILEKFETAKDAEPPSAQPEVTADENAEQPAK